MAKTYSNVPDKSVGNVFTEAMWDDYIKTNINNLMIPPMARAYISGTQGLNQNVADTFNCDGEAFDTDTMHDTVTNNDRLTFKTAGIYLVVAYMQLTADVNGAYVYIEYNGDAEIAANNVIYPGGGGSCAGVIAASVNDYVTASGVCTVTGGCTIAAGAYIAAFWMGKTS
jgi:hypothetical protein